MSCKCVLASCPCTPCPFRILPTFLQTHPVKGITLCTHLLAVMGPRTPWARDALEQSPGP